MGAKKIYRRVSITTVDGRKEAYHAKITIEADPETGTITYRVFSKVLEGKCHSFLGTGNTVEDHEHLERISQRVYEFDESFRVRAVPKPVRDSMSSYQQQMPPQCPRCGDSGYVTYEDGYQETCECRE